MIARILLASFLLLAAAAILSCRSASKTAAAPDQSTEKERTDESHDGLAVLSEEEVKGSGIVTSPVIEGAVLETIPIQGRVIPRGGGQAAVFSPFPGRLIAVEGGFPIVGSLVRKGQLLATVEQELSATEVTSVAEKRINLDSQVEQAANEVAQKTRDLERARALYEGGVIALKQLQQAETDLSIARARHQSALRSRERYDALQSSSAEGPRRIRLTAPLAGTVTGVNAAPNQRVDSAKPIFEIVDLSTVWVEAQVFEEHVAKALNARSLDIAARSAPGAIFKAKLVSTTRQVDPISKTEGVIFEVANRGGALALGMTVDVRLPSAATSTGLLIPASAIIEQQDHPIVFVEQRPGAYERRSVKIGAHDPDGAIVVEGLTLGEKVVTAGAQVLANRAEAKKD